MPAHWLSDFCSLAGAERNGRLGFNVIDKSRLFPSEDRDGTAFFAK